jgi:hypothetical protein
MMKKWEFHEQLSHPDRKTFTSLLAAFGVPDYKVKKSDRNHVTSHL